MLWLWQTLYLWELPNWKCFLWNLWTCNVHIFYLLAVCLSLAFWNYINNFSPLPFSNRQYCTNIGTSKTVLTIRIHHPTKINTEYIEVQHITQTVTYVRVLFSKIWMCVSWICRLEANEKGWYLLDYAFGLPQVIWIKWTNPGIFRLIDGTIFS